MIKRQIRNVNKALTEEERARHAHIRGQIEQEKPELIARGRRAKERHNRFFSTARSLGSFVLLPFNPWRTPRSQVELYSRDSTMPMLGKVKGHPRQEARDASKES
jgi:hypothetical protein